MDEILLERLRSRRPVVKREWETLLRIEPVASPLGHPDTLSHLIDHTLDDLFHLLKSAEGRKRSHHPTLFHATLSDACECGRNPLLAYFVAGERSLMESLVLAQTESTELPTEQRNRAVSELITTLHALAWKEIKAFCDLCQHRPHPSHETQSKGEAQATIPIAGFRSASE